MKTKIYVIMTGVLLLAACSAQGVLEGKIFTSSGQILPGEQWGNVDIYNDDTVVDMLGGGVDSMGTYDASTLNLFDGYVSTLEGYEFSTANISGGDVYGSSARGYSTINFYDGASAVSLGARDFGTVTVRGGVLDYVRAGDSGTLNLYGGLITTGLNAWGSGSVNVFGYDLVLTSFGGSYGYGQVYGYWLDNTAFSIDLSTSETYQHINLIPEPSSLAVLGLGVLLAKRACRLAGGNMAGQRGPARGYH